MRPASRLLELVLLMRPLLQGASMRRTLPKLLTLIMLSVAGSILAAAIVIGGFYTEYVVLTTYAVSEIRALLITLASATALLVGVVFLMRWRLRRLRAAALPSPEKIADILDAFIAGFSSPKSE